jgi:hypothetical protein
LDEGLWKGMSAENDGSPGAGYSACLRHPSLAASYRCPHVSH